MEVITREQLFLNKDLMRVRMKKGEIFIYPTDTIYGIGCNALDPEAVRRLRTIKGLDDEKPLSVIAPSKQWIEEHCALDFEAQQWLDKLPGPYTLILKLKDQAVPKEVNNGAGTLGIRIPHHWISACSQNINVPIITTSANKTGEDFMTSVEDLDLEIKSKVDLIIDEGPIQGKPSTIVNLSDVQVKPSGKGGRKVI